jgi:hypothetical protein
MILNYTTKVPVSRSVDQIVKILVKHGASSINQEYDNSQLSAVSFKLRLEGTELSFRLPIDHRATLEVMKHDGTPRLLLNEDQARRVSWRIIKDWVEVQLALAETRMVTIPQVFLPYAVRSDGKTLYQVVAENPTLLLGDGQ